MMAIYKCRLCGREVIEGTVANKSSAYLAVVSLACGDEIDKASELRMKSIHSCRDGSIGITDFQGVRNDRIDV